MLPSGRVEQLLEEVLISDRTPEQVCAGEIELLPEVRRHLRRLSEVESELRALFPRSDEMPSMTTRNARMTSGLVHGRRRKKPLTVIAAAPGPRPHPAPAHPGAMIRRVARLTLPRQEGRLQHVLCRDVPAS